MTASPHDALFKASFGQPDLARSELALLLPPAVRTQLDLATLSVCAGSFIDDELRNTHSDLLYAVRTREDDGDALVYVLFEHQSSFDATMPFRLLRYLVRVWERWLREHPGAKTLPIVLPVVLHHGDAAWQATPELRTMFDASRPLLDAVAPFVPHFRFLIDDLAALSARDLSARALDPLPRLVQLVLWASRSFPRLREAAPFMSAVVSTIARDERTRSLLAQLFAYVLRTASPDIEPAVIRSILFDVAGHEGKEDVVNAGELLIEQGRAEGLRVAITHVLAARSLALSEIGRARLASCSDAATLTRWLERAATAASESEVFA